jgi:cell wall-active antibiotic response 4TMS protein YvqF
MTSARVRPGALVAGFILLAAGTAMLLDTTGLTDIRVGRLLPPFILIALGSAIVLDKGSVAVVRRPIGGDGERVRPRHWRRRGTGGIWLIGIGVWMLVSQTHLFGLSYETSWPLFIILSGLIIMIRGTR